MSDITLNLHLLRNPWGHSDQDVRDARLWAADAIEALQRELSEARAEVEKLTGALEGWKKIARKNHSETEVAQTLLQAKINTLAEAARTPSEILAARLEKAERELAEARAELVKVSQNSRSMEEQLLADEAERDKLREDAEIGFAVNLAAKELPDGWIIYLAVERGAAWAELRNPDGDLVHGGYEDMDGCKHQIQAAIDAARKGEKP